MFDAFSSSARRVVDAAADEARLLGHARVGTEHLLLGLLDEGVTPVAGQLLAAGATLHGARRKAAEVGGAGGRLAPPGTELGFSARASRALERSFRFSVQRRQPKVEPEHLLLGVLDVEGTAGQVLRGLGVDVTALRQALEGGLAGPRPPTPAAAPASGTGFPRCAGCGAALEETLAARSLPARIDGGARGDVAVAYCSACGHPLGVAPG